MKFYIIHGAYGNPEENWFPWLKKKLEGLGQEVFIPKFPTPKNQTLGKWLGVLSNVNDSVLIGHSLGVPFILNLLEKNKAKAAFLVAGFCTLPENEFKEGMYTFVKKFAYGKIKDNCNKFIIFHSDNDPYVPLEKAEELKRELDGELIMVKKAGHFNEAAGYTQFELLLEKIKKIIKNENH